jgi:hypothetical protein
MLVRCLQFCLLLRFMVLDECIQLALKRAETPPPSCLVHTYSCHTPHIFLTSSHFIMTTCIIFHHHCQNAASCYPPFFCTNPCVYLTIDIAVDGFKRCEKWERPDTVNSKETMTSSWLNRFIGRAKKPEMTWPYPFSEGKMFVLTIQAGVQGYHLNVGGRHAASFPHRMVYFQLLQQMILFRDVLVTKSLTTSFRHQCLSGICS